MRLMPWQILTDGFTVIREPKPLPQCACPARFRVFRSTSSRVDSDFRGPRIFSVKALTSGTANLLSEPLKGSAICGMVTGMATTKVTITLEADQLEAIRTLVAAGKASNVSVFIKHAVGIALHDAAGWKEMLEDALQQTGGPLTKKERAWADALLSPVRRKARSRRKGPLERYHV